MALMDASLSSGGSRFHADALGANPNPNPNPNPNLCTRLLLGEHAEHAEWPGPASDWWAAALCTALVCLLEAWTTQIDNLFLPIYYCAVLLLVDLR